MKIRQQTKKEQRLIVQDKINSLNFKQELSSQIVQKVISLDPYKKAKSIMVYLSLPNEVDTSSIVADALNNKDLVCVPITREEIHLVAINKDTRFVKGLYNVPEPDQAGYTLADVDVAIIPMVAFDKNCNRLGHGKGFFDKFLIGKKCFKIGLAFGIQEFEKLSVGPNDVKMDMIVTEKEIIYNNETV